jgi:hypothetical protein
MIRPSRRSGGYYCDGHECGYPVGVIPPDPEDPLAHGLAVCLDCNASMYIDWNGYVERVTRHRYREYRR